MKLYQWIPVVALAAMAAIAQAVPAPTRGDERPNVPVNTRAVDTTLYIAPLGAEGEYGTAVYNEKGQLLNDKLAAIAMRQAVNGPNKRLILKVGQSMVDPITKNALSKAPPTQNVAFWVGCYVLIIDWHYHYVGGCIQKNIRHLNVHVRNGCSNTGLFDLHVTGWREGRTPILALYNSYSGWCNRVYFGWDNVKGMVYAACVGYVGYWGAVWISNALTPLIFAAVLV